MSGHNRWSKIKHKKGASDQKRGREFTKAIKEITLAAREGGGDPNGNARLRSAIASARAVSMPNDNIVRAIKKGTGELEGNAIEEIVYEGYGPGGIAILLEIATDNRNRSTADIRHILSKNNGNLGESGCVSWMFTRHGIINLEGDKLNEDKVMEAGLEIEGFEDLEVVSEGQIIVYTQPNSLYAVREALEKGGFPVGEAKTGYTPQNRVLIQGKQAEQMLRLMDMLEDNEDIQNVYHNFDMDDKEMERIANQ